MTRRKTPKPEIPRVFSIDWPPGFVSAMTAEPKRLPTHYAEQQRTRKAGGFDDHAIKLPGSARYTSAGPVQMMERKA